MSRAYTKMVLRYDPLTGLFTRNGKRAGTRRKDGRIAIFFQGKMRYAHIVAWFLMKGEWPTLQIDHRDVDEGNNCWENLREATHTQNQYNKRCNRRSSTGVKGVTAHRDGGFSVHINGKYLRKVKTIAEGAEVYKHASREHHGEFGRTE